MCQGEGLYQKHLANEIIAFVHYKKARTCKEKEAAANQFLQSNQDLKKMFCGSKCVFRQTCSLKKGE
jgi:hypothetical protein